MGRGWTSHAPSLKPVTAMPEPRYTWGHTIAARKSDPGTTGRVPRGRRVSVTIRTLLDPSQ